MVGIYTGFVQAAIFALLFPSLIQPWTTASASREESSSNDNPHKDSSRSWGVLLPQWWNKGGDSAGKSQQIVGRVSQMEHELDHNLDSPHQGPEGAGSQVTEGTGERKTWEQRRNAFYRVDLQGRPVFHRIGTVEDYMEDDEEGEEYQVDDPDFVLPAKATKVVFITPDSEASSAVPLRPQGGVLTPKEELLWETLDIRNPLDWREITPDQAKRITLNLLDKNSASQGLSCGATWQQSFKDDSNEASAEREAAVAALPRCPSFQPCTLNPPEEGRSTTGAAMSAGDDSGLAVCSSGLLDKLDYSWHSIPLNCLSWHNMPRKEKLKLMRHFLVPETPYDRPAKDESEAELMLLKSQPELGCSQRPDFVVKGPVGHSVFRLKSVYLSGETVVFNKSFVFKRLGCGDGEHGQLKSRFTAGKWKVKRMERAVSVAYLPGGNFYHTLAETLPLFLSVAPILHADRTLPVVIRAVQARMYRLALAPLLGVPLDYLPRYEMEKDELFHADTLYQPLFQNCGRASRVLWNELRRKHLLHPLGVPIFNTDWTRREVDPLSQEEMEKIPNDWVVVVAKRPGTKRVLAQSEEIVRAVARRIPKERIVVFHGNMTILQARELFRKTRLLIAGHGAAMANMVFMPEGASVIEVRPDKDWNSSIHFLADACSLNYYLVMGQGDKDSAVDVNVEEVDKAILLIMNED